MARHLAQTGHRVVVTGGRGEATLADAVVDGAVVDGAGTPGVSSICGQTDLVTSLSLVRTWRLR